MVVHSVSASKVSKVNKIRNTKAIAFRISLRSEFSVCVYMITSKSESSRLGSWIYKVHHSNEKAVAAIASSKTRT